MKKIKLDYPGSTFKLFGGNWVDTSFSHSCCSICASVMVLYNIPTWPVARGISSHFKG